MITADEDDTIGEKNNLTIRGYQVKVDDRGNLARSVSISVQVCDFKAIPETVQFRWLQTSTIDGDGVTFRDAWSLDDVHISYEGGTETGRTTLLDDPFDGIELK